MKKFLNWTRSSGVRLAFIFALTTTTLLIILNIVVSQQSEGIFVDAVRAIPYSNTTHYLQMQPNPNDFLPGMPKIIENLRTPRELFTTRFHTALEWVTAFGIAISILLGFLVSQELITKPLKRLQLAITKLKERDFSATDISTGLPEFDLVVQEFNSLAHELEKAEVLRRDLISDTSHELKTPLTSIQALLEGMRDGVVPLETERISQLLTQVARLHDLTERLQEYTRLRNRTAELNLGTIPLKPFFEKLEHELSAELEKSDVKLTLSISDTATLRADERLIEELFVNLFKNTITYAGAKNISITLKDKYLYFADDGKGVPSEAIHHIFERFYRVEHSRNRNTGGLGLGLAIVREITEAHGWTITAKPVEPQGLAFIINLSPKVAVS